MDLVTGFGLVAAILVVSALVAGLVDRGPVSFPIIFLGLGLLLGGGSLGVIHVDVHSPALEVVATLTLALVLFIDAVNLEGPQSRRDWLVPALVLGPGTLMVIVCVAGASLLLLDVSVPLALLLGAVLASTDAVVLRDVVRDERVPRPVRRVLSVEAGTNDIIVLPLILVLIAAATGSAGDPGAWALFGVRVFVLGPVAGFAVGAAGSWLMARADERFSVRHTSNPSRQASNAAIVIFVARPAAIWSVLSLRSAALSRAARAFIAWFGPRGLNSLLFALLIVQGGVPGGRFVLAVAGLVVLVSVVAHGASATPVSAWYGRRVATETLDEERISTATGLFDHTSGSVERASAAELAGMLAGQNPPGVLDVRSRSQHERDGVQIPGGVRLLPDAVSGWAASRLRDQPYVLYCT